MICPACDYELSFQSECCENCGAPVYLATAGQAAELAHCTYCGARAAANERECPTCGLKKNFRTREVVIGTCRNCGAAWRQVWLYCQACGVARENGLVDTLMPLMSNWNEAVAANSLSRRTERRAADEPRLTLDAAELLSESEVVERMFANGAKRESISPQNGALSHPSPVPVPAVPPPPPPGTPPTTAAPAPSPATEMPTAPPSGETVIGPTADVPGTAPVQAVRYIRSPHARTAVDQGLIKIIVALIGLILLFSALIVSGVRLRDLFGRATLPALPAATPTLAASPVASENLPPAPPGMVYVPGGRFQMGADEGDSYAAPAHEVTVAPFFMDHTEVTNEQYAAFLQATKHPAPPDWQGGTYATGTAQWPIVQVSWEDAKAYAAWAGKRLPTEAEWEFAARSLDGRLYPWGVQWDASLANTGESNLNHPVAVGSYRQGANPLGIFDLAGNVWEWTDSDVVSYKDAKVTLAPGKVIRGGAFYAPKERASTVYRGFAPPDKRATGIGFRCVQDVK